MGNDMNYTDDEALRAQAADIISNLTEEDISLLNSSTSNFDNGLIDHQVNRSSFILIGSCLMCCMDELTNCAGWAVSDDLQKWFDECKELYMDVRHSEREQCREDAKEALISVDEATDNMGADVVRIDNGGDSGSVDAQLISNCLHDLINSLDDITDEQLMLDPFCIATLEHTSLDPIKGVDTPPDYDIAGGIV